MNDVIYTTARSSTSQRIYQVFSKNKLNITCEANRVEEIISCGKSHTRAYTHSKDHAEWQTKMIWSSRIVYTVVYRYTMLYIHIWPMKHIRRMIGHIYILFILFCYSSLKHKQHHFNSMAHAYIRPVVVFQFVFQ